MSATLTNLELPATITVNGTNYQTQPLLSGEVIQERVAEMGRDLAERYADRGSVHVLTVMNGALHFASDLRRNMQRAAEPGFMVTSDQVKVSSYAGTQSSGVLHFQSPPTMPLAGRNVLVAEDIFDSGVTLNWLMRYLQAQEPASVEVAVAVNKDSSRRIPGVLSSTIMHIGFDIPDAFIVGYGLDIDQQLRDLEGIHTLTELPR